MFNVTKKPKGKRSGNNLIAMFYVYSTAISDRIMPLFVVHALPAVLNCLL